MSFEAATEPSSEAVRRRPLIERRPRSGSERCGQGYARCCGLRQRTTRRIHTLAPQYWNSRSYVEMADRISARRGLANTFFLTLNTAVFTVIGVFWETQPRASAWLLAFPLVALLGQCIAWYWLLRSYRQLNSAKYRGHWSVGRTASRLSVPASRMDGTRKDRSKYRPLTHLVVR